MNHKLSVLSSALLAAASLCSTANANQLRDNGFSTISPTYSYTNASNVVGLLPGGIGHQPIVPYYNVQAGNATLINLVNTDTINGKAVKVRFAVLPTPTTCLTFSCTCRQATWWTANISRGTDGRAVLTSTDKSCTIPQSVSGTSFVTARLNPRLTGDALAAETREGYVEIFNMADVPPFGINLTGAGPAAVGGQSTGPGAAPFGAALATANPLFTATKHVAGVAPCFSTTAGAAALNALQNDPADIGAAYAVGLRAPSTGLYANWPTTTVKKSPWWATTS